MNSFQVIIAVIGTGLTILGGLIGYLNYRDKKAADARKEGQENGVICSDLGYIKKGIEEIKVNHAECTARRDKEHLDVMVRLGKVEDKASSAHHRIDGLEKVIGAVPNKD